MGLTRWEALHTVVGIAVGSWLEICSQQNSPPPGQNKLHSDTNTSRLYISVEKPKKNNLPPQTQISSLPAPVLAWKNLFQFDLPEFPFLVQIQKGSCYPPP